MRALLVVSLAILLLPSVNAGTAVIDAVPVTDPVRIEAPASDAAWARAVVAALPRATAVNDADGDKVWDTLEERFLTTPRLGVVVTFVSDVSTADGLRDARRVVPDLETAREFSIIPGFSARLTLAEALALGSLRTVRQVEYDHPAILELDTATAAFGADTVVDAANVTGSRDGQETDYTTEDVVIAILDTGFNAEHKDLDGGKILHFHDLATAPKTEPYDDDGHGSHVAGIAAGTGDADPRYRGVAPGAAIVGVKLVGTADTLATAISGYEWIVTNKDAFSIDIATMSFGFGPTSDGTSALELAVDKAWEAGIVCFKSAGNSGSGRGTITIPGGARGIIATGSMLDAQAPGAPPGGVASLAGSAGDGGFLLSSYSSRGPTADGRVKPDIVAPGQSIMSVKHDTTDGYIAFSGTSMASPFAAGSAALVLDADPDLTPDEVRDLLVATAEDWGVAGPDVDYGNGRLRVDRAVEAAFRRTGANVTLSTPVHPFHETRAGVLAAPYSETSIQVEDVTHPFAVTAIVEGVLIQLVVIDPDGTMVAGGDTPTARQHQIGLVAKKAGAFTIRLVGQPGSGWVVDVSHGSVPDGVTVPTASGLLEGLAPPVAEDTPAIPALLVVAVLAVGLAAVRRRRR